MFRLRGVAPNAAAVLLLGATQAFGVPLTPPESKSAAGVDPNYDWSGFYLGANAGFGTGQVRTLGNETRWQNVSVLSLPGPVTVSSVDTTSTTAASSGGKPRGMIGGVQAGYNWQAGNWLFGVEADIDGSDQRAESLLCTFPDCSAKNSAIPVRYGVDWFGTLRGRVGLLTTKRLLLYATGGLAYGHFTADAPSLHLSWGSTRVGWTVGGGAEVAIDRRWSMRLEYLHTDFGNVGSATTSSRLVSTSTGLGLAPPPAPPGVAPPPIFNTTITTNLASAFNSRLSGSVIRMGINYRFGGPSSSPVDSGTAAAPLVVKY